MSISHKPGINLRRSISGKMFATKLKVIQHVMTIIEIEPKGQQLLLAKAIDYVRNIIYTKNETY